MSLLFTYLSVAATFVAFDMIWLKTMVERLYRPVLGDMLRSEPDLAAAAVFYLAYPVGLIWFANCWITLPALFACVALIDAVAPPDPTLRKEYGSETTLDRLLSACASSRGAKAS